MDSRSRLEDNPNEQAVVVVTGAAGAVGSRVVRQLVHDHAGIEVRAVDKAAVGARPGLDVKRLDLASDDLTAVFAGATSIVHLATAVTPDVDDPSADERELAIVSRVLDAAAEVGVSHVCVLSTAMVYGAWVDNPVPLTEDAEVRPNPDFPWAITRAAVEWAVLEWGSGRQAAVSILRPTAVVTDDTLGRLAQALHTARVGIAADGDPPVQYLHVDDLAAAIVAAIETRFDGVANVAPDGWIPPDSLADLEGPQARVRVPTWAARAAAAVRQQAGLAPIPPGIVPYTSHSWVVANDRIRALGWEADYSNEQAWVVSHDPRPLEQMPARQRQEFALAVAAALAVGLVVGAVLVVRRLRRG